MWFQPRKISLIFCVNEKLATTKYPHQSRHLHKVPLEWPTQFESDLAELHFLLAATLVEE